MRFSVVISADCRAFQCFFVSSVLFPPYLFINAMAQVWDLKAVPMATNGVQKLEWNGTAWTGNSGKWEMEKLLVPHKNPNNQ